MNPLANRDRLLDGLRGTAAEFVDLLTGADPAIWLRRPAPDEWCLTEIACHLRDVEREVNFDRLRRVAAQPDTFISAADTDPLAETRRYYAQDGPRAFQDFLATRSSLIEYLAALPPETWQYTARHALFGPTRFSELVSFMIDHDRLHLDQVREVLAAAG